MKKAFSLIIVAAIVAAGYAMLNRNREAPPAGREAVERSWPVQTQPATIGEHAPEVLLYGQVFAPRMTELTAEIAARVEQVHTLEGQTVTAGQLLVELDKIDVEIDRLQRQAEIDEIRARIENEKRQHRSDLESLEIQKQMVELAERQVDRVSRLKQTRTGTESALDDARSELAQRRLSLNQSETAVNTYNARLGQLEAQLAAAEAALARTERDLRRATVLAPYSGHVTSVSVSAGDFVSSGTHLLSLFDGSYLELRAQIPNRLIAEIRRGLEAGSLAAVAEVDGGVLGLELDRLGGLVAQGSGGVDAYFRFSGSRQTLEAGRTVSVTLTLEPVPGTFLIPQRAVYNGRQVYLLEDGRMHAVDAVRIGTVRRGGETLALLESDGVGPGDELIVSYLPNAIEGLKVEAVDGGGASIVGEARDD